MSAKKAVKKVVKKRGRPAKVVEVVVPIESGPEKIEYVTVKALILGSCNNPTWVRGRIDGFGVNVKVPAQMSKRLIGNEVNVILVDSESGDYYQYVS